MLTPGDGIAIAGICGMVVTALVKWIPQKKNGYVTRSICDTRFDALQHTLDSVEKKLNDIEKFLRGDRHGIN